MFRFASFFLVASVASFLLTSAQAQQGGTVCQSQGVPATLRAEGLAERLGDFTLVCTGNSPNTSTNITLFFNTQVTNRIRNGALDIQFTIDTGSGPQTSTIPGVLAGSNQLLYTGVPIPPGGRVTYRWSNVRAVAGAGGSTGLPNPITVNVSSTNLLLSNPQLVVGRGQPSLFGTVLGVVVGTNGGLALPSSPTLSGLYSSNAVYSSVRITESIAGAFLPKDAVSDQGTRVRVSFRNLPPNATLLVPDFVAGSDAQTPSVTGQFGRAAAAGVYSRGALLLGRVQTPNADGSGGQATSAPPSGQLDGVNSVPVASNGTAAAIYEVLDANPSALAESAQIPAFLGYPRPSDGNYQSFRIDAAISYAPVSTDITASLSPIPRFSGSVTVGDDCQLIGDCGASYRPVVTIDPGQLTFTLQQNNGAFQSLRVSDANRTAFPLSIGVSYGPGASNWLNPINPIGLSGPATLIITANANNLAVGQYTAQLTIDSGLGGQFRVPVTLNVVAPLAPPRPIVSGVGNAATFSGPIVAGSYATISGSNLASRSTNLPSVSFDGTMGQVVFASGNQINVLVPASAQGKVSTQLVVSVDGLVSDAFTAQVADFAPGIFSGGVLNQDGTPNRATSTAGSGTILQAFLTGLFPSLTPGYLAGQGPASATIDGVAAEILYGGQAPGIPGIQQVNLRVPSSIASGGRMLRICAEPRSGAAPVCSAPYTVYIQ